MQILSNTQLQSYAIPYNHIYPKLTINLNRQQQYKYIQKNQIEYLTLLQQPQQQITSVMQDQPNKTQAAKQKSQQQPNYFRLMEYVGAYGRYQKISMVIWCIMWLVTGTILLGTPFFMYNPPYSCKGHIINNKKFDITTEECQNYVCTLPAQERLQYKDQSLFKSISTQFEDLHCQKAWIQDLLSSLVYLGCFFGYISISMLVDNLGRKKAILIAYMIAIVGMVVAALAPTIYIAGIGLFLMGLGSDSAINICFYFITQTMQAVHRQKFSILIQVFFSLGGLVNVGYFYICHNWRIVTWIFLVAPSAIALILILKFIKDTPYFLIKLKPNQTIISQLNHIKTINDSERFTQQQQSQIRQIIIQLKKLQMVPLQSPNNNSPDQQLKQQQINNKIYTPLDLFRYKSIRFISIAVCLLTLFICILYYGPLILINKLSFNLYINALVVTSSEMVTYPFSYFLIQRIKRQRIGIYLNACCAITSFSLIFIIGNLCQEGQCNGLKILQLIFIFIFRFCCSLQFAILLVYSNQVFPTQIRGLGLGVSSALGTIASTSSPYIFGSSINSNYETSRTMIIFVAISIIGILLWIKLPETLNKKIHDEIQQVRQIQVQFIGAKKMEGHIELVEVKQSD